MKFNAAVAITGPLSTKWLDLTKDVADPTYAEARLFWDDSNKTYSLYNDDSSISLPLGTQTRTKVYNNTGVDITSGKCVSVTGIHASGYAYVALTDVTISSSKSSIVGFTLSNIASGGFGYVLMQGSLQSVNTSAFPNNTTVWLSITEPGGLQDTEPGTNSVLVGTILVSSASVGTMIVNIRGGGSSSDQFKDIINPLDAYFGTRLTPIEDREGLYVESALNKATGYLVNNTNTTGNVAISGFRATINGDAFDEGVYIGIQNHSYYAPWLRAHGLITAKNLNIMVGDNTGDIVFSLGNTATNQITEGQQDKVLLLNTDRTIVAPALTNALILTGGDQSLVTKKFTTDSYLPINKQLAQTKALVAGEFFTSYNATTGLFTSAVPSYFVPSTLLADYGFVDNSTNWNIAFGWGDHLGLYVGLTGDETVAGIKTFSSFSVTPSAPPILDYNVANKKYVDDSIVAAGGYTDEQAQDAVGNIMSGTGATSVVYNDTLNTIVISSTDTTYTNLSEFINDSGYLTSFTETDPIFLAHVSSGIVAQDITNWYTAFSWGDHSTQGYLTSFTETDPIFTAHVSSGITALNITNWDTAFGWGDHSVEGYLKSFDITTQTDPKYLRSDVDDTFTGILTIDGTIQFTADDRLQFSSEFASIYEDNVNLRGKGVNEIFFTSEAEGIGFHFIEGETISYQDVTAGAFITDGGAATQFVKGDGSLDSTSYATIAGIGSEVEEEINFAGGETQWVLSGTPSASFPHRLYAGTTSGGGLILLDEGVDYTLTGSTITYSGPVLPIDPDEKHIIQYNTATVPLTYPTPYADVIYRNADMWEAVDSSAYYFKDRSTYDQRNLQLFIMTDIHGDVDRMNNGITLMNQFDTIDGALNMGDTCIDTWLNDYTFVDPFHTIGKPVLISIGNHDEGLYRTIASTGSSAQSYARFIQPYEVNIGGVHAGKSYYYKDWTSYKIRTINMYDMDDNDDIDPTDPLQYRIFKTHRIWSQAQLDWLEATLASTPTDYAVIVITHYPIEDQPNITVDYTCKLTDPTIVNWDAEANYVVGNPVADMMEAWITGTASGALSYATSGSTGEAAYKPNLTVNVDFISRGVGHFITYLCGHVHQDGVGDLTGYTTQKIITINCTTSNKNRNKYGSTQRKLGTRSEDLLTTMAFDTVNRKIKVVRLGAQFFTEDMRKMDQTVIDY